jgi:hypothetical protein
MRAHYFARNIDNIWVCSSPNCNQVEKGFQSNKRKFGKLYSAPQNRCKCGAKILEAIICRQCGEIFLAGYEENGILNNTKPLLSETKKQTIVYKKELLEIVDYQDKKYAVLIGTDANCTGCTVLEVEKIIDDTMSFYPVESADIANQVFEIFKEHAKDTFSFE